MSRPCGANRDRRPLHADHSIPLSDLEASAPIYRLTTLRPCRHRDARQLLALHQGRGDPSVPWRPICRCRRKHAQRPSHGAWRRIPALVAGSPSSGRPSILTSKGQRALRPLLSPACVAPWSSAPRLGGHFSINGCERGAGETAKNWPFRVPDFPRVFGTLRCNPSKRDRRSPPSCV